MPVVLVIIILAAWIVVLGPSVIKRRARGGGNQSITHFHYQLRVLEHSAPEPLIAPAYRLRAVDGGGSPTGITYPDRGEPPVLTVVGAKELPRPALAFLGDPVPDPAGPLDVGPDRDLPPAARADDPAVPDHRRPARYGTAPTPPVDLDLRARPADGAARHLARRRRRDTLLVLVGVLAVTVLLGLVTGSTALWAVCTLDAVALAAYVAVLVQLRRRAEERESKLHYLEVRDERGAPAAVSRSYVSGRYAHPSNQHAAAR
jgi:hypothetical protein